MYFITTFDATDEGYIRKRCHGFVSDIESAKAIIKSNHGDIYENGYYNMALIEVAEEGLYTFFGQGDLWYGVYPVFNDKNGIAEYQVYGIDRPEWAKNTVGYSF